MTREAKISLLVGLCFLIVMGILLSDAYRTKDQPPAADLAIAGRTARAGISTPGSSHPPVSFVQPLEAPPRQTVPVHEDLIPPHLPVTLSDSHAGTGFAQPAPQPGPQGTVTLDVTPGPGTSQSSDSALAQVARQLGQPLVAVGADGRPIETDPGVILTQSPPPHPQQTSTGGAADHSQTPPTPVVAANRTYVAQNGDSVSKMAAHFFGTSTKTTRNLIIQANPTLQQNPDRVVAGETYIIPAAPTAPAPSTPATPAAPAVVPAVAPRSAAPATPPTSVADTHYTVQPGDNLWKIARDQLGDPHQVDAIKQLNIDVLRGDDHETVVPGMKLTLPSRAVAAAR
jgi:nucleoid-associated protein YgaU